jgi:beta-N-acetylhexosaminidase
VYPTKYAEIGTTCTKYAGSAVRPLGVADSPLRFQIGQAAALAAETDVMVVFTEDAIEDAAQQNLVNALRPDRAIVVALKSPYDVRRFPNVGGFVLTYEPDPFAFEAACAVLFGAQPARGRLPVRVLTK